MTTEHAGFTDPGVKSAASTPRPSRPHSRNSAGDSVNAPRVLFVCVKNGGKSQMAAALMRHTAAARPSGPVEVTSAGTRAGDALNAQSAAALAEVGIDITQQRPRQLTDDMTDAADLVVVLGADTRVSPTDGTPVEIWDTDEPSHRGIEGMDRMRLIRDDIAARVQDLHTRLTR